MQKQPLSPLTTSKSSQDNTQKSNATSKVNGDDKDKSSQRNDRSLVAELKVAIGDRVFSLSAGEILLKPYPYIWLRTDKMSELRVVIRDPIGEIYNSFGDEAEIKAQAGFVGGRQVNKFIGKIKNKGRVESSGTLIVAIDNLAQLGKIEAAGVSNSSLGAADTSRKTEDTSDLKIISSSTATLGLSAKTSKERTGDGKLYDPDKLTIAHPSLAIGTKIEIFNPINKKKVLVTVNDKRPAIEATPAVFKALDNKGLPKPGAKGTTNYRLDVYGTPTDTKTGSKTKDDKVTSPTSTTPVEKDTLDRTDLKFAKNATYKPGKDGSATIQQSAKDAAKIDAVNRGDKTIGSGNTIKEISPDQAQQRSTGIVLDYKNRREVFIDYPIVTRRTALQVNSGASGILTIKGWDAQNKQVVSASVSTNNPPGPADEFKVYPLPIGSVKMTDPIFIGCQYTWGDAFRNGDEISKDPQILKNVIQIAQVIDKLTIAEGKGKWQINSWYRSVARNNRAGGKTNSAHLQGYAVDAVFPGMFDLHRKLLPTWKGGLAVRPGVFIHIDTRFDPPMRRWIYGKNGQAQ
jgi:hypothetical protein